MAQVLQWPLQQHGTIEQGYGPTTNTSEWALHGYDHWHSGIDIAWPDIRGAPILAAADGTVQLALNGCVEGDTACNDAWGNYIIIQHTGAAAGLFTLYAHQTAFAVAQGDTVRAGQVIGYVGSTGNSTGPHLHFEVRNNGGGWKSDVNPAPYLSDSPAATGALPLPKLPDAGDGGTADSTSTDTSGPDTTSADVLPPPIGADKSPIAIRHVAPRALSQQRRDPAAGLWIGGQIVAVESLTVTLPGYRHAGSWSATLSLDDATAGVAGIAAGKGRTQVVVFLGYVDDIRRVRTDDLANLPQVFTGLLDGGADYDYQAAQEQLTLSGPDLSGLLSTPSAAAAELDALLGGAFMNLSAYQVAAQIARNHNLGIRGTDHGAPAGGYYGSDDLTTRQQGRTEWDVVLDLAKQEGRVCYMDGSTLVFDYLPTAPGPGVTLVYGKGALPAGQATITRVRVRPQPHSLRDYRVVVQSWDTDAKGNKQSTLQSTDVAGDNPDSTQVITITAKPNLSQGQLDSLASSVAAAYAATETLLELEAAGPLGVSQNQPLSLQAAGVIGAGSTFYPVTLTYSYSRDEGITCQVQATSRPFGVQSADALAASGLE